MGAIVKIARTLYGQYRTRGLISTLAMNRLQLTAMVRGFLIRLLYFRNIKSTIFSIQANSTIEIFNRRARLFIGRFVFIRKNASIRIDHDGQLLLGDKVFINDNCNINCVNKITIGAYTKIAPNVCINDHDHNYKEEGGGHLLVGEVTIGEHVWIGSNVVILRDTVIGDHAVIAAGSVVKGKVPPRTLFLNKRENGYIGIKDRKAMSPVLPVKESI
ncbi:acyltransferase [Paenibacillus sp. N4]|uniref:acyltransferase n=1 Tax=Paenibacillus vietnamensis TaxID=2590547 RepID=UPI001CD1614C|nr:acyltransferase [Paenibacillus vietnamensis]MCA0755385.1 acyltransferase [Paenibacillus vietnamensis]